MKLEIPEIKLKAEQNIWALETYPSPGMYIVDDGIMLQLAWFCAGSAVQLCPIPHELLERCVAAKERVGVRDKLSEEIHDMKSTLNSMKPESGFISEASLLKAIAIVQDSSLAVELLK